MTTALHVGGRVVETIVNVVETEMSMKERVYDGGRETWLWWWARWIGVLA